MQRQSLGSPGSKHHPNGCRTEGSTAVADNVAAAASEAEEEIKAEKLIRLSSRSSRTIHLIPLLTLLCFLILYMISHEPAPLDLPSTRGFGRIVSEKRPSPVIALAAIRTKLGLTEEKKFRIRNRRLGIA